MPFLRRQALQLVTVLSPVQVLDGVASQVEVRLPDVRGLNVVPISALTGTGTMQLLPAAVTLYEAWTRRIPTARLNRWLVAVRCAMPRCAVLSSSHSAGFRSTQHMATGIQAHHAPHHHGLAKSTQARCLQMTCLCSLQVTKGVALQTLRAWH